MNNENTPPHALLQVSVERHIIGGPATCITAKLNGCRDCLSAAITQLLLHDKDFKELINRSVRAANEIKGRAQN